MPVPEGADVARHRTPVPEHSRWAGSQRRRSKISGAHPYQSQAFLDLHRVVPAHILAERVCSVRRPVEVSRQMKCGHTTTRLTTAAPLPAPLRTPVAYPGRMSTAKHHQRRMRSCCNRRRSLLARRTYPRRARHVNWFLRHCAPLPSTGDVARNRLNNDDTLTIHRMVRARLSTGIVSTSPVESSPLRSVYRRIRSRPWPWRCTHRAQPEIELPEPITPCSKDPSHVMLIAPYRAHVPPPPPGGVAGPFAYLTLARRRVNHDLPGCGFTNRETGTWYRTDCHR